MRRRPLPTLPALLGTAGFACALASPWIVGPSSARMFGTAVLLWLAAIVALIARRVGDWR